MFMSLLWVPGRHVDVVAFIHAPAMSNTCILDLRVLEYPSVSYSPAIFVTLRMMDVSSTGTNLPLYLWRTEVQSLASHARELTTYMCF